MCITPIKVKNSGDQPVPCGRCSQCRARRASGWSFRLMQEEKISISSHFITLTYDNKNVPLTLKGFMGFDRRHVQLFFKRLRKAHTGLREREYPIRYYLAGEYGGKTSRPHYHVILFNARVELIQPSWWYGQVWYGGVSGASVGYTLKYISKQSKIPMHANDDRPKEFSLMSKGLGKNYLTPEMVKWHKADLENRMFINIGDGKKAAMPRYYKLKLYDTAEAEKIKAVAARLAVERAARRYDQSTGHPDALKSQIIEREKKLITSPYKDNL